MTKAKKLAQRGFTLIELMIVVVIIGILASLAIYGVQKYVTNSKSAEARMMLGKISKDAMVAYEGETMSGALLAGGGTANSAHQLCPTTTKVPTLASDIAGVKYQPGAAEWEDDPAVTGWPCLGFAVMTPIYFQYQYTTTAATTQNLDPAAGAIVLSTDNATFTAHAVGNLSGKDDGPDIEFVLYGQIADGVATLAPTVLESSFPAPAAIVVAVAAP